MRAFCLVVCLVVAQVAQAQVLMDLTPAQVATGIAQGQSAKAPILYRAGDARFTTPYARVVNASWQAKQAYQPFTSDALSASDTAPEIEVFIPSRLAGGPRQQYYQPQPISPTQVVIMPEDSEDIGSAIRGAVLGALSERYQNLLGATFDAHALVVRFPIHALADHRELRVRYSDGSERRYRLKTKGVR